jgi:predicted transcriptional regulator
VRLGLRVNVWLDVADLLNGGVVGIDDLLFVIVGLTLPDKDVVIDLLNG